MRWAKDDGEEGLDCGHGQEKGAGRIGDVNWSAGAVLSGDPEDQILANAPQFVASLRQADRDARAGCLRPAGHVFDELEAKAARTGPKAV